MNRAFSLFAICAMAVALFAAWTVSPVVAALAAPVAVLLGQPLYRSGTWYLQRDAICSQVQVTGLSLQMGALIFGWAPRSWFHGKKKGLGPTRLILMAPPAGHGRFLFQLLILGRGVSIATPTPKGHSSWSWPGPGIRAV